MPGPLPPEREALLLQRVLAAVFVGLGSWCLLHPASVIELTVRPEQVSLDLLPTVAVGAFGAQAILAGLFAASARFTSNSFLLYGVALLPFFVFDWWFYFARPLFNGLILLDVIGNVIMLAVCARGYTILRNTRWRLAPRDGSEEPKSRA